MWTTTKDFSAEALEIGLINKVVPDDKLKEETRKFALESPTVGPFASPRSRAAFNARHGGVSGCARRPRSVVRKLSRYDESKNSRLRSLEAKPDSSKFGK